METIGAIVDCGAALVLGFILGFRWTLGPPWHLMAGALVGVICAVVFFVVANWLGRMMPGMLEARLVGLIFMGLIFAAALSGGFGAWFGYRKSLGRGLF